MTELPVDIIRSPRRQRTIQAAVVNGALQVRVPAGLPPDEEQRVVDEMVAKMSRKISSGKIDLEARAKRLARRYDLPEPNHIAWSDRQNSRWGSCTPANGTVRISSRLADIPDWVLDYVLVHELAHLEATGHGGGFQALVNRYELAERAKGYLMAINQLGGL